MIPLRDDNPSKSVPFVNVLFIFINVSVFLYQYFGLSGQPARLYYELGCIPYEFTHFTDMAPTALVPVPLTIFTAMFLHGGWIHLLSNMLFLWIFGDNIEDHLGHGRYIFFYLLCGIAGFFSHIVMNVNSQIPSIGASGAIAGVMGAYMILYPKARIVTLLILVIFIQIVRIPAIIMIGYWLLIQILSGLAATGLETGGGVAWFAHIGGFIAGLILILLMKNKQRYA